jgi:uncharacterized protein (TIGR03437 family)
VCASPTITGLANNATNFVFSNTIAPGEEVNITGSNLGDATTVGCGSPAGFLTSCCGVSVTVAGKAAGVRNEVASQVVIQVPVDAPLGGGQLVLTRSTGGQNLVSQPFSVNVAPYAPELYLGASGTSGVTFGNCFNAANSHGNAGLEPEYTPRISTWPRSGIAPFSASRPPAMSQDSRISAVSASRVWREIPRPASW